MKLDTSDFIQRAIYLTGDWSPEIGGLFAGLRPGDLFVDIGANVGFFSLLAASKGAEVIAFEPNQACVAALVDNLTLNDFDNVQIRSVALGNTSGRGTLSVVDGKNLGSGSIEFATSSSAEIEVDTLDAQLAGRRPSLIKIDVEGAEFLVLQGALETLRMSPAPKVVLEISEYSLTKYGATKDDVFEFMDDLGFRPELISAVRQSRSTGSAIHFQYDVLFSRS